MIRLLREVELLLQLQPLLQHANVYVRLDSKDTTYVYVACAPTSETEIVFNGASAARVISARIL